MRSKKTIFLDTNILLHYLPISQIDWTKLTRASQVNIIIAPIVVNEIDKKKIDKDQKIRKRASRVLTEFSKFIGKNSNEPLILRKKVYLFYEDSEPKEFLAYGLDPSHPDDRLIASILKYKAEHPECVCILISGDMGCCLKAQNRGIVVENRLPDELKLTDDIDPNEAKIRELEQELRNAKLTIPKLSLLFENRDNKIEFTKPDLSHFASNITSPE